MTVLCKIELDHAVGIATATFYIEHLQSMLVTIKQIWEALRKSSRIQLYLSIMPCYNSSLEIDVSLKRLMDTADIHSEFIIDEHPHIIITGEFKDDRITAAVCSCFRILRERELNTHRQAEMMIEVRVPVYIEIIIGIIWVEREEPDRLAVFILHQLPGYSAQTRFSPAFLFIRSAVNLESVR